ncbi:MAG: T9SS C-terminal target domain-containing protein [Calditrichaeota bacterium]|nr:MAG: T9SS C-terminal target domain-containing protein [Calditrichota bacterium]
MKDLKKVISLLIALIFAPDFSSHAAISLLQSFSELNTNGDSYFGGSVSGAGDVNNDGYDDVIVGAHYIGGSVGRAYIYYGGSSMDNSADVVLSGEGTSSYFGISVSGTGDVNNDGYDDVIVGAYYYNSSTGRAYIYYGSALMDNTADVTLTGEGTSNYFGYSVADAGDVNNDGFADVIIGAYQFNSSTGRSYIYLGSAGMDNTVDVTMTGEGAGNQFGFAVSGAGDVNNDGYDDVIVGTNKYNSDTGRAYIYLGGAGMDATADVTMTGAGTSYRFGVSVSGAGDVNHDGFDDVIIGANYYNYETGRAYVYYGASSMDNSADVTMTGAGTYYRFGLSVSGAGDVNHDDYDDIIIGSFGYSSNIGRAYVYLGGAAMDATADIITTGEGTSSQFGYAVSGAGDVNNDGYADVIVGATNYQNSTGRTYVYYGGGGMDNAADVTMTGEITNNYFGISVSGTGDVNNDSYDDVIVGAYRYNSSTGRAYVYYGGSLMDAAADVTMTGEMTNNYFGYPVSSAGDVNNDGYDDVIIGAYFYNSQAGRVYVYFGSSSMDNIADVVMTGEAASHYFGKSATGAGDVNNDGYDDVIVGAQGYGTSIGRAYVFYGGSPMDASADITMTGEGTNSYFGGSASGAGDVNNDNYDDVIVGAQGYSSNTGRAYVYFGGLNMDTMADVTMTGEETSNYFGQSLSGAGDVNLDGYDDVIVGANWYNSQTGRAYIYLGGDGMNNVADITMQGETTGNYFGLSVSDAGDINKDGYNDVIVAARGYNFNTGRVYIYFGGGSMDNTADLTMTGEAANNSFGSSVSNAGDVNNDGYDDVIVGAYNYPLNGKAYLYAEDTPIVMELSSFNAQADQTGVVLYWETQSESNLAGYHLYRRQESAQEFVRINEAMILSQGTPVGGAQYHYVDVPAVDGSYVYKLQSLNLDGSGEFSEPVSVSFSAGIGQNNNPTAFALHQNYPNPFNPQTAIRFDLPTPTVVTLTIYDAQGRIVRTLVNGHEPAGVHNVIWDGRNDAGFAAPSGLYLYHINAGDLNVIRKMMLLK